MLLVKLQGEGVVSGSIEPKSCGSLYKQDHEMTVMISTYLHVIFIAANDVMGVTFKIGLDENWFVLLAQYRL
jgi:hypothetical protein